MKKLIVGNWKLNPLTVDEAVSLASRLDVASKNEVVICPPLPFLESIEYPHVGAQDCSPHIKGAYTGEVSPAQLASMGIKYCIVGHSERRAMGEDDALVNAKVKALLEYKITPIVCVGFGTTVQEDELEVMEVVGAQLEADLEDVDPTKVVVAYEPVWAIGHHHPATADHAEQIALYINTKHHVSRILYGGSVNSTNAGEFLHQQHISGLLIGGASLLPDDFNKIMVL
ncbi:MAG TPA: triose-phosphate isomerase [Patescibacteria group bacterium]|jgi:triosephosphate isomerase|nr:triose-phosphate isomerase [Patescibacteria group bacterium]